MSPGYIWTGKLKKNILEPNRFLTFNGASNLTSIVNRNILELKSLARREIMIICLRVLKTIVVKEKCLCTLYHSNQLYLKTAPIDSIWIMPYSQFIEKNPECITFYIKLNKYPSRENKCCPSIIKL